MKLFPETKSDKINGKFNSSFECSVKSSAIHSIIYPLGNSFTNRKYFVRGILEFNMEVCKNNLNSKSGNFLEF
jgi:hypothetical protein